MVFSRNATGAAPLGLLTATANTSEPIVLPDKHANGTNAILGEDSPLGFPTVGHLFASEDSPGRHFAPISIRRQPLKRGVRYIA